MFSKRIFLVPAMPRILAFGGIFFVLASLVAAAMGYYVFPYCQQNFLFPQTELLVFPKGSSYEKEWSKVDSLANQGLYKSALQIVEGIYSKAKTQNDTPQLVKAIIHRMKFEQYVEEYSIEKAINKLREEVTAAKYPLRPVLHSILAESYWSYYQNNRWKFSQRTQTVNFLKEDISTWDLNSIVDQVVKNYQLSLQSQDSLKNTKLGIYDAVIVQEYESRKFRATLYDFLAHRALDFYMNTEPEIIKPAYKFEINSEDYFNGYDVFVKYNITSKDSLSLKYYAMKIFQELLIFHVKDTDPLALVDVDLKRLGFIRSYSTSEFKDSLYLEALRKLEKRFFNHASSSEVTYYIANEYYTQGVKYNPLISDENKWKLKEAIEICNEGIKRFPESFGATNCRAVIETIQRKDLNLQIEKVNLPDKPFLSSVKYNNVKKIYLRACVMDIDKFNNTLEKLYGEELVKKYLKLTPLKEWSVELPDDGDFQPHRVEIKIPELPLGHYVLLAADNPTFSYKKNAVAYAPCWVSDISYINRRMGNGSHDFFMLSRAKGNTLKGVTAQLWYEKYDYTSRKYEYVKGKKYSSDENGFFNVAAKDDHNNIDNNNNFNVQFLNGKDELHTDYPIYLYRQQEYEKKMYPQTFLFTDRAIYRPGQTIYFKGIMINTDGEKKEILPRYSTPVTFYDANSQKIASVELTTNEYGSFNGTFTAPHGMLNGQMYISNGNGTAYVSVEDYKRPKFEVTVNPVKGAYRLGDEIKAEGSAKSYAGSNIDGAQVAYRVVRNASFPAWCYWGRGYFPSSPEMEITNGMTTTNDTGGFVVRFKAIPDLTISKKLYPTYAFTVYADVTDINGETHSTQSYVSVAYTALNLGVDIGNMLEKEAKNKFTISTTNMNGQFEPANGTVDVFRLKDPGKPFRSRSWEQPDKQTMNEKEFHAAFPLDQFSNEEDMYKWPKESKMYTKAFSNTETLSPDGKNKIQKNDSIKLDLKNWTPGVYVLEAHAKDKYGEEVKDVKYFTVYSSKETNVPANFTDWYTEIKSSGEPGEKAKFLIGSKWDSVKVLYEVEHKNTIVQKEWITLNHAQKLIEIPIEEKHRGGFSVHFTFVKNNRLYKHDATVIVPWTNKMLDIEFETFRNKLLPGQKEEWKLKIKGKNGDKVAAEMVATLYDASLDAFRANNWYFNLYNTYYSSLYWASESYGNNTFTFYHEEWFKYPSFSNRSYDQLNWFGYGPEYYGGYEGDYRDGMVLKSTRSAPEIQDIATTDKASPASPGEVKKSEGTTGKRPQEKAKAGKESTLAAGTTTLEPETNKGDLSKISARANLNETAFFYPDLMTDENGSVIIKFTIPEALTKWKMLGLAHTKDLKSGQITNELVTQKELMVMPNPPRFFREDDKIFFTTKISNLSDKDLSGIAQLELFDAVTMKPIDEAVLANYRGPVKDSPFLPVIAGNPKKDFQAKKGQSTALSWEVNVPEGIGAITYKVVAKAGNFTDGEESAIPVLTNRMLVTESLPLPIRSKQSKTFKFEKLISQNNGSSTLRNHKLTLEFTANPAWYAVQSLPYLMEYPYECAEQTFSRYYANSIAAHIANSSPKIKQVFESWKSKSSEAFLSNLEKNQELKSLMLEETPWVLEAKDESERKKRVGLLFDLNKMSYELDKALNKLMKMQVSNGGWPWFEGMPDDRYITQHIITGMGHLDRLGVKNVRENSKVWEMVRNGARYLDDRIREDYEWILKHDKTNIDKNHLYYQQIQYLYARSYFKDIPIQNKNQKAFDYYKGQAQKYWLDNNRYLQGMIALALHRYDDKKIPPAIMKSLKETSLSSEEMGMYWKDNYETGWYWYQAPIEAQALLIEAFDEVANDKQSVDDLKVWLLKSKQTQNWKTTKATTEACYALLLKGTDWLATESNVEIIVGSLKIDPKNLPDSKQEEGTGYFKTSWNGTDIKPAMGNVTVTKKDEGVSWGALYWQYFEQLDKITPHKTPLQLVKKLFIEKNTASGPVIEPINANTTLKSGDKLKVRIELRVDRDMEYVHMKDMRASGFEPTNVFSHYKYQDGLGYYESTRDAATNFFFSRLPKGTYVFEYPLVVSHSGDFSNGITSIQCMYAPEFTSHSEGMRVKVGK